VPAFSAMLLRMFIDPVEHTFKQATGLLQPSKQTKEEEFAVIY